MKCIKCGIENKQILCPTCYSKRQEKWINGKK